jgi:hypothetical protein
LPRGQKWYKEYFLNRTLEDTATKTMKISIDHSRVHNGLETAMNVQRTKIKRLAQPSYSSDLSICDFWFFGLGKIALLIRVLWSSRRQRDLTVPLLMRFGVSFEAGFEDWIVRSQTMALINFLEPSRFNPSHHFVHRLYCPTPTKRVDV